MGLGKVIKRVLVGKDDRDQIDDKKKSVDENVKVIDSNETVAESKNIESVSEIAKNKDSEVEVVETTEVEIPASESELIEDEPIVVDPISNTESMDFENVQIDIPDIKNDSETDSIDENTADISETETTEIETKESINNSIKEKIAIDLANEKDFSMPVEDETEINGIPAELFENKTFAGSKSKEEVEDEVSALIKNHYEEQAANPKESPIKFSRPSGINDLLNDDK